jgi:UDP-N-acetylglucosamine--N-acetylmuramyl-(pentapeptide) pyrophosphoryl-undecaprenol N-acetylglucosamine transferase
MTEINFFGLPAIYVPYPHAADGHQSANAKVQVDAGAGVCFEEEGLSGRTLAGEIGKLANDRSWRGRMAEASRKLAVPNAAEKLADLLCELAERRRSGPILRV